NRKPAADTDCNIWNGRQLPNKHCSSRGAGGECQPRNPRQETFAGSPCKQQPKQRNESKNDPGGQDDKNQNGMKKIHCKRSPTAVRGGRIEAIGRCWSFPAYHSWDESATGRRSRASWNSSKSPSRRTWTRPVAGSIVASRIQRFVTSCFSAVLSSITFSSLSGAVSTTKRTRTGSWISTICQG